MSMNPDLNEIEALVAKAEIFAAAGIDGDVSRHLVPHMNALCEGITAEIGFARLPGLADSSACDSAGRLAVMLELLRGLLIQSKALDLAQEIGRRKVKITEQARRAARAKTADKDKRVRQVAKSYEHFAKLHPDWLADMIYEHIRNALNMSERTLQSHLAAARAQGLISKRHRRTP